MARQGPRHTNVMSVSHDLTDMVQDLDASVVAGPVRELSWLG